MNPGLVVASVLALLAAAAYLAAELFRWRRTQTLQLTAKEEQTALAVAFVKTALEALRRIEQGDSRNFIDAWMFSVRAAVQIEAAAYTLRHEASVEGTKMARDDAFGIVITEVWRQVYGRPPEAAELGGASLKWRCMTSLETDVNDTVELQELLLSRRNEEDANEIAGRLLASEARLLRLLRREFPEA